MDTPPVIKLLIVLVLLTILGSLGVALWHLIHDHGESTRTVKALTLRIALSLGLFALLIAGMLGGIIVPHGITPTP